MRPITIPSQETISRLESEAEGFSRISQKRAGFALIVFRQNPVSLIGLLIVVMLILASIAGPYIVPYGPDAVNPRIKLQPPSLSHPLGTDTYGRDVLSRVVSAARVDLLIAMTSIGIAFAIGIVMGSIAAYLRGLADTLLMRFLDIVQSFPQFILGMGLAVAIGPGLRNLIIVITVIMTPGFARMVRSRILSLREMPYVDAARCSGVPALRIIFVYLVPNSLGPIIVSCALNISYAMLDAAGLDRDALNAIDGPARSESDVARAILEDRADAGLAIEAAARGAGLDFVPLHRERYDLVVMRRDYFEPPLQALLDFARSKAFQTRARDLGGYDLGDLGKIIYNAP